MIESSKYDFFMDELTSLEKQIYSYIQKDFELSDQNKELKKQVVQLEKENEVLKLQLKELEEKISQESDNEGNASNDSINPEEKEILKSKIDDLITKIDFHLRS